MQRRLTWQKRRDISWENNLFNGNHETTIRPT